MKKNKQPAHTPGGPGRLRSWSGPVETDFQGRPRFSSDNRPGYCVKEGGGEERESSIDMYNNDVGKKLAINL